MKDLLLEENSTKFTVEDHRWRFTETRLEYIAQKIRHTVSVFLGEWFLDRTIGIPYIPKDDTRKEMHRSMIETALQVRISGVEGVEKVLSFSPRMDKAARVLTVDFMVQIDSGETYSDSIGVGIK